MKTAGLKRAIHTGIPDRSDDFNPVTTKICFATDESDVTRT
jgi:hypothetical protein